jgi:hypothetical protein
MATSAGTINVGTAIVRIDTVAEQWDGESIIFQNDGPSSVRIGGLTTASLGPAVASGSWSPGMSPGKDGIYAAVDSGTAIIRVFEQGV